MMLYFVLHLILLALCFHEKVTFCCTPLGYWYCLVLSDIFCPLLYHCLLVYDMLHWLRVCVLLRPSWSLYATEKLKLLPCNSVSDQMCNVFEFWLKTCLIGHSDLIFAHQNLISLSFWIQLDGQTDKLKHNASSHGYRWCGGSGRLCQS